MRQGFLVLDFGSQYTWLLARRFRELGYYSEVVPYNEPLHRIKKRKPLGIILSGGPSSVTDKKSPSRSTKELLEIAPVLAICYGMQLVAHQFGGKLVKSKTRTYGKSFIKWNSKLISSSQKQVVWMSHGESVKRLPKEFKVLARNEKNIIVAFGYSRLWAFQFHPEVSHTEKGLHLLKYFAKKLCKAPTGKWKDSFIKDELKQQIKKQIKPHEKVFCALSGGVDSTVTAILLTQALGISRVICLFVDTGLLRKNEYKEVLSMYKKLKLNVKGLKKESLFLKHLKGVTDPEKKRKIIGKLFIDVFKEEMKTSKWLAQGTLYPDIIESFSHKGVGVTIKSHHNVGGLPKKLNLKLVEPLKKLFKDDVRKLGCALKIPTTFLNRHPFPGPGLAVRCLGEITNQKLHLLREADAIYQEELKKCTLYDKIWQAFSVLIPVYTVGVQGDQRTYEQFIALRAVTSVDGMTADWYPLPNEFLHKVSSRIINEVKGINRVVYDVTTKPPGTIEWE